MRFLAGHRTRMATDAFLQIDKHSVRHGSHPLYAIFSILMRTHWSNAEHTWSMRSGV